MKTRDTFIIICACLAGLLRADVPAVQAVRTSGVTESRVTSAIAPGSTVSARQAMLAANLLKRAVPGTILYEVKPTGSMRPLFDGNCLLLTEPAPYNELDIGDIVVYQNSRTGEQIVHRILERRSGGYWTKGDHNSRMDDELVTPKNYIARIYGIIYTERNNRNLTPDALKNLKKLSAKAD